MTLGLLIELEAFKHTEAIQEVSGQASSEASLEAILKKVRNVWVCVRVRVSIYLYSHRFSSLQAVSAFCFKSLFIFSSPQVEDSWKATEFIILPHRESKDVFILGGTDDIQQLLDDSNINMATIASSRHVGPIR